jgi:hypothetical protein
MKTENYIDGPTWDAAKWRQTVFLVTPDLDRQPGLTLCFENLAAGKKIFSAWRQSFGGPADRLERLRIVIIRGRHPDGRNGFTLGIGTDTTPPPGQPLPPKPSYTMAGFRWRFQGADEPQQSLQWFQASYQRHRMFFLVPLSISAVSGGEIDPDTAHMVGKTRIYFRTVEEVIAAGAEDQDSMLIQPTT